MNHCGRIISNYVVWMVSLCLFVAASGALLGLCVPTSILLAIGKPFDRWIDRCICSRRLQVWSMQPNIAIFKTFEMDCVNDHESAEAREKNETLWEVDDVTSARYKCTMDDIARSCMILSLLSQRLLKRFRSHTHWRGLVTWQSVLFCSIRFHSIFSSFCFFWLRGIILTRIRARAQ